MTCPQAEKHTRKAGQFSTENPGQVSAKINTTPLMETDYAHLTPRTPCEVPRAQHVECRRRVRSRKDERRVTEVDVGVYALNRMLES